MGRLTIVAAVLLAGCFRGTPAGEQPTSFTVPGTPEQVLARAEAELGQMGFQVVSREQRTVITAPRPVPDSLLTTGSGPQLWFLRVSAKPQVFTAGSAADVRAYLVPAPEATSGGNLMQQQAIEVTSDRPALFNEVRRIAGRVQSAAGG
jgi:hypothetical protein